MKVNCRLICFLCQPLITTLQNHFHLCKISCWIRQILHLDTLISNSNPVGSRVISYCPRAISITDLFTSGRSSYKFFSFCVKFSWVLNSIPSVQIGNEKKGGGCKLTDWVLSACWTFMVVSMSGNRHQTHREPCAQLQLVKKSQSKTRVREILDEQNGALRLQKCCAALKHVMLYLAIRSFWTR